MLISLININYEFNLLINNYLDIFTNINNYIYKLNNENYVDNKNYDKYKCFTVFYVNLIKNNILSIDILINILIKLQNILFENILVENKKEFCEYINYTILLIISNIYNSEIYIQKYNLFNNFYDNVFKIKNFKCKDYSSLTNKIIFANMDIFDKYKIKE